MLTGHPFMTSTQRGSDSSERMGTEGGGQENSRPTWTSAQKNKIRFHWIHPVFFSCKQVDVFLLRVSSLGGI